MIIFVTNYLVNNTGSLIQDDNRKIRYSSASSYKERKIVLARFFSLILPRQIVIKPLLCHQFLMGAFLRNTLVADIQNTVGIADGG